MRKVYLPVVGMLLCLVLNSPVMDAQTQDMQSRPNFKLEEHPDDLTVQTSRYQLRISRKGFALNLYREGKLILQSAQPGDSSSNLAFSRYGTEYHVTRLNSYAAEGDTLTADYATDLEGAVARVTLSFADDSIRIKSWVLNSEGNLVPELHYRLSPSGFWYGGGFQGWRNPQTYPLNDAHIEKNAFFAEGNTQGTPIWYSTSGAALWIQTPKDFRFAVNRKFNGKDDGLLSVEMPGVSSLTYEILIGKDIRDVIRSINRRLGYPSRTPPEEYFRLPIYTTWVEFKVDVSQQKVLEFAHSIHDHQLPCGVIEIDDKWEDLYGDTEFDGKKFPDPKAMVDELHRLGYRVTLWVHPFVNIDSKTYAAHRQDGILARDLSGSAGLIRWWNGTAAVWDFTNPVAAQEFRGRLRRWQERYGIDGFKFDGGDVNLTPRDVRTAQDITPSQYADIYNRETTAHFVWNETRVGIYSQKLGIVQRLIDKHSVWGIDNGLAAIIPEAITVSLRGFPYVMPDMVGGNQYDGDVVDKELLIRWAQASALMPLIQFSVGPWHFDDEAVALCRQVSELHVRFAPYIYKLAQQAPLSGEPILLPLWYNSPQDAETYHLTDEFMLGEDVVVAPVVRKGARQRDLYLPEGKWRDYKTGEILDGGMWVRGYPAPLDTLPIFVREGADWGK